MSKQMAVGSAAILGLIFAFTLSALLRNSSHGSGIVVRNPQPEKPREIAAATSPGRIEPPRSVAPRSGLAAGTPATQPGADARAVVDSVERDAPSPKVEVVVHVAGAVKRPGVYHLGAGARNEDAVKAAGGLAASANADSVNLAALAADGTQLYVKSRVEQPTGGAEANPQSSASTASGKKLSSASARLPSGGKSAAAGKPVKLKSPAEGRININTASAEELQRISGIGPSMAEKIIAYRQENHGFQSLDDLMQVNGVGAKKFARWSPFLRLH
jgi:competence protein ComEA